MSISSDFLFPTLACVFHGLTTCKPELVRMFSRTGVQIFGSKVKGKAQSWLLGRHSFLHCVSKNKTLDFFIITLANVNRSSKFFHSHIRKKIL